jgi:hypothetical protein
MPCSNCGNCGHNVRTCPITVRVKPVKRESELTKLQKKFKKERKRSIKRLREIRAIKNNLDNAYEAHNAQVIKISTQQKKIEGQDDTISKLRKNETDVCNICFESIAPGAENKTECGHAFHCGCLLKWLKKNNSCPCCRKELYEIKNEEKNFDAVVGNALVNMYGYSIIRDPEINNLLEFSNNILNGLIPEDDLSLPDVRTTIDYIVDYFTDDDAVETDSSDDEEEVWQPLIGSDQDDIQYSVNTDTGEIRQFPLIAPVIGLIDPSTAVSV